MVFVSLVGFSLHHLDQPLVLPRDHGRWQSDLRPIRANLGQDGAWRLHQRETPEHHYGSVYPSLRYLSFAASSRGYLAPQHVAQEKTWYSIDLRRGTLVSGPHGIFLGHLVILPY